ncbi:MAG: PilZ domain-containing protein [Thermoguttaceae bacterium]|jgi:hypothetical protein
MDSLLQTNSEPSTPPRDLLDRRKWTRVPPEIGRTTIYYDGRKIPATIMDESFGGLGLLLPRDPGIAIGSEVRALYHGFLMKAVVRFAKTVASDRHRMGIEWC